MKAISVLLKSKRVLSLFVLISILFSLSSCASDIEEIGERNALPKDLHNVINFESVDDEYFIWYNNELYTHDKLGMYHLDGWISYPRPEGEGDILLSWNGFRYGYIDFYYSYTTESPLFIYEWRLENLYFREDYDYLNDVFIIDGTEREILFSEMFSDYNQYERITKYSANEVNLTSKTNPRIKINFEILKEEDGYYISPYPYKWKASDTFVEILKDCGLITW